MAHRPPRPAARQGAGNLVVGVVCGMEAEARALGRWARDARVAIAVSGGRPDRAEAVARRLAADGAGALLSWGIAGALDPALASGALIAAGGVVGPDGAIYALTAPDAARPACDQGDRQAGEQASRDAWSGLLPPPSGGRDGVGAATRPARGAAGTDAAVAVVLLAGSDTIVLDPAAKAALRRRTGAAAVDMETHRVAAVAARAGLPCFAVRAVSDPSHRRLPALAATALDAGGRPRPGAVLAGLLRRPGDLPALVRAAGDSRAAMAALRRAADPVMSALLAGMPAER